MQRSSKSRIEALEALEAEAEAESRQPEPLTAWEREWLLDDTLAAVAAGEAARVAARLVPDVLAFLRPQPFGMHGTPAGLAICACGLCVRMMRWQALEEAYAKKL
jgi:hypothetical protein